MSKTSHAQLYYGVLLPDNFTLDEDDERIRDGIELKMYGPFDNYDRVLVIEESYTEVCEFSEPVQVFAPPGGPRHEKKVELVETCKAIGIPYLPNWYLSSWTI